MDADKLARMKDELRRNCERIAAGDDPVQARNGLDSYRIFTLGMKPLERTHAD